MTDIVKVYSPLDDEDGTKATFRAWLVNVGAVVQQNDPIAEIETDKVTVEVHAPCGGKLIETFLMIDDIVEKGALLANISQNISAQILKNVKPEIKPAIVKTQKQPIVVLNTDRMLSPAVRKLLSENGLSANQFIGSGKNGRISKNDVLNYLNAPAPVATNNKDMPSVMEPHTNMRRIIAKHMLDSVIIAPHVTAVFEADLSAIIQHRKTNKVKYANLGVNLSFTGYFIAASVIALIAVPKVNSRWHDDALEIFSCLNIGIGTSLGDSGLIVPVIHNTQNMDLFAIAKNLQSVTQKARDNKLVPSDLKNGTFTISNHGTSGSLIATPIIINQPQSAILGIGKMQKRPIVVDMDGSDAMVIKPMCYISLTIDHRVLDGHQTNSFLSRFVETLENWQ